VAWNILFFETERGEKIVKEFITTQEKTTIAKIIHKINLLETYGPLLDLPHSKKITTELYELRIRGRNEIRVIYTFLNRNIYLLHAFKKKTQKIPIHEIETAKDRYLQLLT